MTDKPADTAAPVTPAAVPAPPPTATPSDAKSGAAWKAAVGIGSAALVAALMYANRRARKK